MSTQKRLTVSILMALLVATVMPLSVLAQDEVPPQPEVPSVVEEEPVVDGTVAEESAAEEPAIESPAPEESATEEIIIPEILEQLPENTGLIVVAEEGESLPLVSEEAAEAIVAGDPYFWDGTNWIGYTTGTCPEKVLPSNCNVVDEGVNPIQAAVDAFRASGTASGDIFVESGDYDGNVEIDGGLGNLNNLTGIIGAGSGSTTLNGSFFISNMNVFTLSGFTVNTVGGWSNSIDIADGNGSLKLTDLVVTNDNEESNGIRVENQTGDVSLTGVNSTTSGTGIYVSVTSGNVSLDDVTASSNAYTGANIYIDSGSVNVNDSAFSDNGFDGLFVSTDNGNVTLKNVTASGNGDNGVFVVGGSSPMLNVAPMATNNTDSVTNVNVLCGNYSDNGDYGLNMEIPGGNAYLGGPIFSGNGLGGYNLTGGTVTFGPCGQLLGGEEKGEGERGFKPQKGLTDDPAICNGEKKVTLDLGDGFGIFQNLCGFNIQLDEVKNDLLPGALPEGVSYLTSMNAQTSVDGKAVDELPAGGKLTLKFPVPDGADEASLAVLFWNGAEWIEVSGGEVVDGFYMVEVTRPGIYVLASQ